MVISELDRQLIALLRQDARTSISELARLLNVSRVTVRKRIERLTDKKVIQGFTIVTGNVPDRIRAIMMIEVEGQSSERVEQALMGFPQLRSLFTTNGRWDLVAEIESDTLETFDDLLRQIRQIKGISLTETTLLLSQKKR